ncbi:MAG: alpha-glucuronidase, partial [Hungatella sp.]
DWRDRTTDRARSGYDHFMPLDGEFLPNVILQIKNGPMDFQVREPVSPLFGGLTKTNQMLEVQIAQEYTGQQKHVCYLLPMWKDILSFQTGCGSKQDTVADIISGKTFGQKNCGMAAVSNTGNDPNWTGHDLAAANLYGFGRLAFDTSLTAETIAKEWISMTYGTQPLIEEVILEILMGSWSAYEKYTSPLGIGWMVNPNHHFGPNVDGYEYDRWGTYHRADQKGIGVDRSQKGTGYAALYHEEHAKAYEHVETCPEELLLFFHYVAYSYVLKTGKTLIQHIYDSHFEGAQEVEDMLAAWDRLNGLISEAVWERIRFQVQHSQEWRDVVNSYFYRKSGIADEKARLIY